LSIWLAGLLPDRFREDEWYLPEECMARRRYAFGVFLLL
jgi:hypothetical protein